MNSWNFELRTTFLINYCGVVRSKFPFISDLKSIGTVGVLKGASLCTEIAFFNIVDHVKDYVETNHQKIYD